MVNGYWLFQEPAPLAIFRVDQEVDQEKKDDKQCRLHK
jgi:hypothetical protein